MADTAVPINSDGSASIGASGNAILSDPASMQCCCCCSASECAECGDDCAPETFGVTIPALTFPVGCQNCATMIGGSPGSWEVIGSWGTQSFCLEQTSGCTWQYADNAYSDVVVEVSEGSDCTAPCYTTHRLLILLVLSGGNARLSIFLEDTAGTCSSDPTNPGAAGFLLFDSIVSLASLPSFCKNGGSLPGVEPLTGEADECGFNNGYDNPWAVTEPVTATVTPCCEVPI